MLTVSVLGMTDLMLKVQGSKIEGVHSWYTLHLHFQNSRMEEATRVEECERDF